MFKRTNGYVLLTLLVLTGLAGRVTTETLKSKERRGLISSLKENRAELLGSVKHLSDRQLDYRPAKGAPTIREQLYHIVAAEDAFRAQAEAALAGPAASERAALQGDEAIAAQLAAACPKSGTGRAATGQWKTADAALDHFKAQRTHTIKFVRTTTGNVRAYTTPTPAGPADVYQLYLGLCAHQDRHLQQIKATLEAPGFPRR